MLIIIEGCDGVGKTTLVEQLKEHLPTAQVLHRGPPERHPLEEYELELQRYQRAANWQDVICDRWHWGELVYGPLYRGGSKLTTAGFWHIDLFLAARGALVVHLNEPYLTVHQRLRERGEDYLQSHDISRVLRAYKDVASMSRTVTLTGSSTEVNFSRRIVESAVLLERDALPLNDFSTYIGSPRPDILVLGERRNERLPQFEAAFTPMPTTSGVFLLQALERPAHTSIGIANACEENVEDLWDTLGRPRTVTLGQLAHEAVEKFELPHGAVPHPQYVRRFHHEAKEAYGRLIYETAATGEDNLKWRP